METDTSHVVSEVSEKMSVPVDFPLLMVDKNSHALSAVDDGTNFTTNGGNTEMRNDGRTEPESNTAEEHHERSERQQYGEKVSDEEVADELVLEQTDCIDEVNMELKVRDIKSAEGTSDDVLDEAKSDTEEKETENVEENANVSHENEALKVEEKPEETVEESTDEAEKHHLEDKTEVESEVALDIKEEHEHDLVEEYLEKNNEPRAEHIFAEEELQMDAGKSSPHADWEVIGEEELDQAKTEAEVSETQKLDAISAVVEPEVQDDLTREEPSSLSPVQLMEVDEETAELQEPEVEPKEEADEEPMTEASSKESPVQEITFEEPVETPIELGELEENTEDTEAGADPESEEVPKAEEVEEFIPSAAEVEAKVEEEESKPVVIAPKRVLPKYMVEDADAPPSPPQLEEKQEGETKEPEVTLTPNSTRGRPSRTKSKVHSMKATTARTSRQVVKATEQEIPYEETATTNYSVPPSGRFVRGKGRGRDSIKAIHAKTPKLSDKLSEDTPESISVSRPRRSTRSMVDYAHPDVATVVAEQEDLENELQQKVTKSHNRGKGRSHGRGSLKKTTGSDDGDDDSGSEYGPTKKKRSGSMPGRGKTRGRGRGKATPTRYSRRGKKEISDEEGEEEHDAGTESVASNESQETAKPSTSKRKLTGAAAVSKPPKKRGRAAAKEKA